MEVSSSDVEDIDFKSIPVKALNISSRLRLAWFLNPEQSLPSKDGFTRDYRGLAEQMDFQYNDIKNFQRNENPTMKILEAWESRANTTIAQLIEFLEKMGRHDIVQDLHSKFENDAKVYLTSLKQIQDIPLQVPEVSSFCTQDSRFQEDLNILTLGDMRTGERTYYDAYVCYADADIRFVYELVKYLECPAVGLNLFIRGRDLLAGHSEHETNIQLIKERCRRMLIILSPEFLKSPSCEFQTSFAAGLAIEQRQRILIPIVLAQCKIPLILRFVSKIDFTQPGIKDWVWDKLILSLTDASISMFVPPPEKSLPQKDDSCLQIESSVPDTSGPTITFPPSSSHPPICSSNSPALCITASPIGNTSAAVALPDGGTLNHSPLIPIKASKPKWRRFKFPPLKGRSSQSYSSSTPGSSLSSATSGFHSESENVFESIDVNSECCPADTSV